MSPWSLRRSPLDHYLDYSFSEFLQSLQTVRVGFIRHYVRRRRRPFHVRQHQHRRTLETVLLVGKKDIWFGLRHT